MAGRQSARRGGRQPSLVAGAVTGAATFAVGYLVTYLVILAFGVKERLVDSGSGFASGGSTFGEGPMEVAAVFFGGHLVDLSHGYLSVDVLGAMADVEPGLAVLYAVPPVLLLVAGALLGRGAAEGAAAGAKLTAGYLPLAVAGPFVVEVDGGLGATAFSPELTTAVVFAGLIYPLLFGAVGGLIGSQ